jgi:WD40 repeat protein
MLDRVGQQLGSYRLLRLIGHGGFAEVYLGQHVRLSTQQAALKILSTRLDAEDISAFEREAAIIAGLVHPHIIRILDYDILDGLPFLVMDYAPNGSLRQRYRRGEQVPLPIVIAYVQQITEGLQYAHDHKIIHRDIKPDNMLVGAHQEIVLSDFGIATIAHSTSSQSIHTAIGTIAYMAPEQIQEHPRPASDQYALAVMVYEWLTGERPFQGSFTEIAVKHATLLPPSLRNKRPDIPQEVEQVILRALAKEPKNRFPNVQNFFTSLVAASHISSSMKKPAHSTVYPGSNSFPPTNVFSAQIATAETILVTDGEGKKESRKEAKKKLLTRRAVILGGLAALGVAGTGVAWFSFATATPKIGTLLYTYHGHSDSVLTAIWSSNSKRIASGSRDKTVQVWDAMNGKNAFIYTAHSDSVTTVAWSPDGKHIASSSDDKTVQVWDAADGGNALTYHGHSDSVITVAWSPDSKHIVSGGQDNTVQVWDATNGSNVFIYRGHTSTVNTVAWSPDGKHIASASGDNTVQIWNTSDGKNTFSYREHNDAVNAIAWSPDSKRVVSASSDKTVQVWGATNGVIFLTYRGHTHAVNIVACSPDGKRIASGGQDKTVQVWDVTDGGNVFIYQGHTDVVNAVAWSPDGKSIASGSGDKTVRVWSA